MTNSNIPITGAPKIQKLPVTVYAMSTATYTCTDPKSLDDKFCDIYFPTDEHCEDRDDIGADSFHYAVDGKDEMVFVDKGLLKALVDQCQSLTENTAVYDDTRGTSYEYVDLNKLVMGYEFPAYVTELTSKKEHDASLAADRLNMAKNISSGHYFDGYIVNSLGEWIVSENEWSCVAALTDNEGLEYTSSLTIIFKEDFTNLKSTRHSEIILANSEG